MTKWTKERIQRKDPKLYPLSKGSTSGGLYFTWEGVGVAVNPAEHFLAEFHQMNHHITEIEHVIVTKDDQKCYQGVFDIYDLVQQYNKVASKPHIIHYYLNETAYQHLAPRLKPMRQEERNTLHLLDFFPHSKGLETYTLDSNLTLKYYPLNQEASLTYGVQFELKNSSNSTLITYMVGGMLPEEMRKAFDTTDILIVGSHAKIEEIGELAEALNPQLLLVTEFTQERGDRRVRIIRDLRKQSTADYPILPVDCGFQIDLDTFGVQCSENDEWVDPAQVRILAPQKPFGPLEYLADYHLL